MSSNKLTWKQNMERRSIDRALAEGEISDEEWRQKMSTLLGIKIDPEEVPIYILKPNYKKRGVD
jgi:hypothetical protein